MRLVFVKSVDAKERLRPTLDPGNVDQTMTAP
jgi:3-hydroxypropanoate dehydrogenase